MDDDNLQTSYQQSGFDKYMQRSRFADPIQEQINDINYDLTAVSGSLGDKIQMGDTTLGASAEAPLSSSAAAKEDTTALRIAKLEDGRGIQDFAIKSRHVGLQTYSRPTGSTMMMTYGQSAYTTISLVIPATDLPGSGTYSAVCTACITVNHSGAASTGDILGRLLLDDANIIVYSVQTYGPGAYLTQVNISGIATLTAGLSHTIKLQGIRTNGEATDLITGVFTHLNAFLIKAD